MVSQAGLDLIRSVLRLEGVDGFSLVTATVNKAGEQATIDAFSNGHCFETPEDCAMTLADVARHMRSGAGEWTTTK